MRATLNRTAAVTPQTLTRPIRIAFLIESLRGGGAERQLTELVTRLDRKRFEPRVMIWTAPDFYCKTIEANGVPVHRYNRRGRFDLTPVFKAAAWLRSGEIDLLHGYLDTGNLYAVLAHKLAKRGRIVLSERMAERSRPLQVRLHKPWSHRQAITIANSEEGRQYILRLAKVEQQRVVMIPNGIDMQRFSGVSEAQRMKLRDQLGWPRDRLVLLSVGRIGDPRKNYADIARALLAIGRTEQCHICWIGEQPNGAIAFLQSQLENAQIINTIDLRTPMSSVEKAYQAADILVHNSTQEGTPNVVLEAMACERPVLATAVGDTARYIRDGITGWMIPPGNALLLEAALKRAILSSSDERERIGATARQYLLDLGMDVMTMVNRHEQFYTQLL